MPGCRAPRAVAASPAPAVVAVQDLTKFSIGIGAATPAYVAPAALAPPRSGASDGAQRGRCRKNSWPPAPVRRTRSASNKGSGEKSSQLIQMVAGSSPESRYSPAPRPVPAQALRGPRIASSVRMERKVTESRRSASPQPVALGGVVLNVGPSRSGASALAPVGGGGPVFGVCGFDPRKPPRLSAGSPVEPAPVPDPPRLNAGAPGFANAGFFQCGGLGMLISGLAAPVARPEPATPEKTVADLKLEEWSSSEDEATAAASADLGDSEDEIFRYRRYRYYEGAGTSGQGVTPVKRRPPPAPRLRQKRSDPAEAGDSDDCKSPWRSANIAPVLAVAGAGCAASSRCSTPRCEEEWPEDEQLRHIAGILAKFYGIPGGAERSIRVKRGLANAVIVDDDAWAKRTRESQLEDAPTVWLRGGRIYDFHGDRGTVQEYEHDLLIRQVEDDEICRVRRRDQGLMPYPFVAAPLKGRCLDPDEVEEPDVPGGPRRKHWLSKA